MASGVETASWTGTGRQWECISLVYTPQRTHYSPPGNPPQRQAFPEAVQDTADQSGWNKTEKVSRPKRLWIYGWCWGQPTKKQTRTPAKINLHLYFRHVVHMNWNGSADRNSVSWLKVSERGHVAIHPISVTDPPDKSFSTKIKCHIPNPPA